MLNLSLSTALFRLAAGVVTLVLAVGCDASIPDRPLTEKTAEKERPSSITVPSKLKSQGPRNVIVSDGPITIENGKVTYDRPKLTSDAEKEIHKSLSFHLRMARSIEERVPGGNNTSRHMLETYELIKKGYMMRYGLTEPDIASILKRGDEEGWGGPQR